MTERTAALTAKCRRCRRTFTPAKAGHIFCSAMCRHRGERRPDRPVVDEEQVARLFDESRDPAERVRPDDWCAGIPAEWAALYACDTVERRRGWYLRLVDAGRI